MQPATPEITPAEQRREPRTYLARPVYVRWEGPAGAQFEEVRTMRDFSASGLYFFTETPSYFIGMRLQVIPAIAVANLEYLAEVVRVEQTAAGDYGVALRLLAVRRGADAQPSAAKFAFESFALADSSSAVQEPTK